MNSLPNSNRAVEAIKNIVSHELENRTHNVPGIITRYYQENHLADVEMYINNIKVLRKMVPIEKSNGFKDSYKANDYVWVSFKGGSIQDPIIVSKYNPTYVDKINSNTNRSAVYQRPSQNIVAR
jgi:hypothetical protein